MRICLRDREMLGMRNSDIATLKNITRGQPFPPPRRMRGLTRGKEGGRQPRPPPWSWQWQQTNKQNQSSANECIASTQMKNEKTTCDTRHSNGRHKRNQSKQQPSQEHSEQRRWAREADRKMGRETPSLRVGEGVTSEGGRHRRSRLPSHQVLATAKHQIRKENEYEDNDEMQ